MKSFKFLPVTYRISIIIALALCAEHSSACNRFKFNSKPSGHNINHRLIKSSNQRTQMHILNQTKIQNHAAKTLNISKQANQTYVYQKLSKNHTEQTVNVSNQEPKCNCKYDIASKVNALNSTSHAKKGKKLTSQSLVKPQVEKISSVSKQELKCNCKQSVGTNANTWKSIGEALDKMAKTYNRDDATKEKAWKVIREALDKMAKTNNPVTPNIKTKQESKCNCKHNDATKENALQHETKFNCKHEKDLKSIITTIKDAIHRVENTLYVLKEVSKLSCDHYADIKKYALLSFNNALNSLH